LLPTDEVHIHILRPGKGISSALSWWQGLLASYSRMEVPELRIKRGPQGKPYLEGGGLHFNLSHSGNLTALSIGRRRVGVDVETFEEGARADWRLIAQRHFSPSEREFLFSQDPGEQNRPFLRMFTLKEARVKAEGMGLSRPFSQFSLALPLVERCWEGPWESLSVGLEEGCLAHVAENPGRAPLRYRFQEWTGDFPRDLQAVPFSMKGSHGHLVG